MRGQGAASGGCSGAPRVFALDAPALRTARARVRAGDAALGPAYRALLRDADEALRAPLVAVTDKHTLLPPSGDAHDYYSLSPYWWPDPSKPGGLPYVRHDGRTNPESKRDLDQPRIAALGSRVQTLALAYYFSGNEAYARRAAEQLRTWFLAPATRMNPNLRYAQAVRGNPEERGSGIIDSRPFIRVVDAVGLLEGSPGWTARDQAGMRRWFSRYLDWLRTSPNGAHERAAKNNHGSWYAAQVAALALFTGDTAQARRTIEGVEPRIGWQITPQGVQPTEMVRTRSLHYSAFNLEALTRLAQMGRCVGVDLWHYRAPDGGSLEAAVDHVAPYLAHPGTWPGQQIDRVDSDELLPILRRASYALGGRYDSAPKGASDRGVLLYPATQGAPADPHPHPSIFISHEEAAAIRAEAPKYPLLAKSLREAEVVMDSAFAHPMDVPQPGEAGGYAHERHKQNYREMQAAGLLYQITGEERYARFVREMLDRYAVLYPTLGPSPYAHNQAPGKIFHQALNEANWLVATAIAYDCVYDYLTPEQRARYEANIFRPMADWLSVKQAKEFDRIHNHGTWADAAVGMIGYVMDDTSYVNRALYGTKRDGTGGFLRQLDLLFSPDGYYMEGPYYLRYALMPFYYFAEAIERNQPELHIYQYRNGILGKGLYAALETAYPNGVFPPINDASRSMSIGSPEVTLALDLAYDHYGADENLLGAAAIQGDVVLNGGGLKVARDMAALREPPKTKWGSVEFTDGPDGKEGGLGILRMGEGREATMVLMKYGVHGQGHGHFDKLHFILFDDGNPVVPDYGFARWINVEPKFGGRYLPENDSYAKQTIAHNTVVVDERSQSDGVYKVDEEKAGQRHFFDASDPAVKVMSARADGFYRGVAMQRTIFLVRDTRLADPVVVDLYHLRSGEPHTYDYPIHFRGQLVATDVKYDAHTGEQRPLGDSAGYQHLWNEATAATDSVVRMTWLDGHRYYSVVTAPEPGARVIFARTGANDPNFNLISEPVMIVRHRAGDDLFASVIEPHGYFSEADERSADARGSIQAVRVLADDADASVVEVTGKGGLRWLLMVTNDPASASAHHRVTAGGRTYEWTGDYAVEGVRK
ncbi:MAG TPA: alginate lyase family protein [Longimicrobiaceae bacterium]|nr:alginate lyase family protein [Longimicrobiaceae bacterium]